MVTGPGGASVTRRCYGPERHGLRRICVTIATYADKDALVAGSSLKIYTRAVIRAAISSVRAAPAPCRTSTRGEKVCGANRGSSMPGWPAASAAAARLTARVVTVNHD